MVHLNHCQHLILHASPTGYDAETCYRNGKHKVIDGLAASSMLSKQKKTCIASRYVIELPYSYPVPALYRDNALRVLQPYLENKRISSWGKSCGWKYEVVNIGHSFMLGIEVMDRILQWQQETTYTHSDR